MPIRIHNLAIEMSGYAGSVTLGRGDDILDTLTLPDRQRGRHDVSLMPAIDDICRRHGVEPGDLGESYVSIGPGSFTGLRIAVATVRSLAQVLSLRVVAVPTIEVIAQNVPIPDTSNAPQRLFACLALKSDTVYTGLFAPVGEKWVLDRPPRLGNLGEQLDRLIEPTLILGDESIHAALKRVEIDRQPDRKMLPSELAIGRSDAVWHLGRDRARQGAYDDPWLLKPLYARAPEAEVLWNQRHPTSSSSADPTSASPAC